MIVKKGYTRNKVQAKVSSSTIYTFAAIQMKLLLYPTIKCVTEQHLK